jgi:hypothetical protein
MRRVTRNKGQVAADSRVDRSEVVHPQLEILELRRERDQCVLVVLDSLGDRYGRPRSVTAPRVTEVVSRTYLAVKALLGPTPWS